MKKIVMIAVGVALFVAGYHQTRRQAEYVITQVTPTNAIYTTKPVSFPLRMKHEFVFHHTKSV